MIAINEQKQCPRCLKFKIYNSDNFFRQKSKPLGLMYHCKECHMNSQKNSDKWKAYQKKYNLNFYHKNKDAEKLRGKLYKISNKDLIRKRELGYYKNNPIHRLRVCMSSLLRYSIKSNKNNQKTFDLLGYNLTELKQHIEKKFQDGMSWDNYGEWHIDHIKPIASFNNLEIGSNDFKECWSLNNLQPLWAYNNRSKGSMWNGKKHFLNNHNNSSLIGGNNANQQTQS